MNKLSIALLFLIFVTGNAKAGRGEGGTTTVGNGGYSFRCTQDDPVLSYDLFKTQKEMGQDFKVSPVDWYQTSLERISALIVAKLPAMSYSFDKFTQQIGNQDPSLQYVWQPIAPWAAEPTFVELDRLAALCTNSSGEFLGLFSQVILRKPLKSSKGSIHYETPVVFYFDEGLFENMAQLDRSFLLVHEWLWNFTDDYEANRKADYLLHSTWFDRASSKEVIRALKKIGIRYP